MPDNTIRFGVFADLHMDLAHDADARFNVFMDKMKTENIDFIIQLGDFCHHLIPRERLTDLVKGYNKNFQYEHLKYELIERFNSFDKPHYSVLGNHEMDGNTKEEVVKAFKMPARYYSFTCKGWKGFVLDTSNYRDKDGIFIGYSNANYFGNDLPYIDPEQLEWLERELSAATMPAILFSHYELNECDWGIKNFETLKRLFQKINAKQKKVFLCVNGHMHTDSLIKQDDVYFYNVNTMSNYWVGEEYAYERFNPDIEERFPNLKYAIPFKDPLFTVITVSTSGIRIEGCKTEYIPPGPEELGITEDPKIATPFIIPYITPVIMERELIWDKP